MNEKDFVQYLRTHFPFSYGLGIGDDASVVKTGDHSQIITQDLFIENVHFNLNYFSIREVAQKALAVNLSDIAAMGGIPQYFYLGLGYPSKLADYQLEEFFDQLKQECHTYGVQLAGGDFSSSSILTVSITVVGKAENPVYRSKAQVDDWIGITGITGESALGLKLLQKGIYKGYFVDKHKQVIPELKQGQILSGYVHAMMDVSDGLLLDLSRILEASQKGAILHFDKIPVKNDFQMLCQKFNFSAPELVFAGGEDYVLLFTISPTNELKLRKEKLDYHLIGRITPKPEDLQVYHHDQPLQIKKIGFDHFNIEKNCND